MRTESNLPNDISLFKLKNGNGLQVEISNLGAFDEDLQFGNTNLRVELFFDIVSTFPVCEYPVSRTDSVMSRWHS